MTDASPQIRGLDHVNLRTARLEEMGRWYENMLGLTRGKRPDFSFPGMWLYAGTDAIIHLVGRDTAPAGGQSDLHLEHFAVSAVGLAAFIARFEAAGERIELRRVPGFPIVQANVWDPDGNHLHVDFDSAETVGMDIA